MQTSYFSGYLNLRKGKASKVFLKVQFITPTLDKLPFFDLVEKMGQELSEKSVSDEMPIILSKTPHA
jgi:hypothetical protein